MTSLTRSGRYSLLLLALLVALVVAFLNRLALSNLILARGDVYLYFYPYWEISAAALQDGRLPLWNPAIFMGAPFLANSQAGFFYPLNWPLWLLFSTPYAVSATTVIHLVIAAVGAFLLGRRGLALSPQASFLAAVFFALGGYLTAQIEHVNQLQGLAWLPWQFLVLAPLAAGRPQPPMRRSAVRALLGVAVLFALQLLAGHTQTAFISGVAVTVWALVQIVQRRHEPRRAIVLVAVLPGAFAVALLLAAVQLGPTLELTALSARQGGLSLAEVLSFSWHPLHLTRSLLPTYGQSLFTEYVAVLPLTALILAVVGAWHWRQHPVRVVWIILAAAGLLLALGRFTPVYWLLAQLPGFDLFRVPARWLVLYALGVAMLAGTGWDTVRAHAAGRKIDKWRRPLGVALLVVLLLMVWGFAAGLLAGIVPTGQEAPFETPGVVTVLGWGLELALLGVLLVVAMRSEKPWRGWALGGIGVLAVGVLWLATRSLPYNHPTTPEAYFDVRPPIARLQALGQCMLPEHACSVPEDRLLGLSEIFFDPGDQAEIDTIYADQLDEQARRDYTVAIKQKEVVSPNLPMVYGLNSVDGFDGGILPLDAYAELMRLILPPGETTTDGRLREYLTAVPEQRWLDLFNARYIITDKVGDAWVGGVFFDRQHPVRLGVGEETEVGFVPAFEGTEIRVLSGTSPPALVVRTSNGQTWTLEPELRSEELHVAVFPEAATATTITLHCPAPTAECSLDGLTLVDERDGAFQPLVPGPFRLILSGDVKLYENLAVQPRAFLVYDWTWQPDREAVLSAMQTETFNPRQTAVLLGTGSTTPEPSGRGQGVVTILEYAPEQLLLRTSSNEPALLLLTDANYPGWQATVDGEPAALLTANGLFRAVFVPFGEHDVVISYESRPLVAGAWLTAVGLLILTGAVVYLFVTRKSATNS